MAEKTASAEELKTPENAEAAWNEQKAVKIKIENRGMDYGFEI